MTRRSITDYKSRRKNLVDSPIDRGVRLPQRSPDTRQGERTEGIKIDNDLWNEEFIAVGNYLCHKYPDPDIYDLFVWIREEIHGCQPFGEGLLRRVDAEIEKESRSGC